MDPSEDPNVIRGGAFSYRLTALGHRYPGWSVSGLVLNLCVGPLMTIPLACAGDAASDLAQQAITAYRTGLESTDPQLQRVHFARAAMLFHKLLEADPRSVNTDLLLNLGNAALRANQLADAIWAYRSTLAREPSHGQARSNLRAARLQLPEWVRADDRPSLKDRLLFWNRTYRRSSLQLGVSLLFLVASMITAVWISGWRGSSTWLVLMVWLCWALLLGSLWSWPWSEHRAAVVTTQEVTARTADALAAPAQFSDPLPAGTEVEILEQRGDWCRTRLANRTDCWLPRSALQFIPSGETLPDYFGREPDA
jgi:Tfp pilus assembly protein PilF